MKSLADQAIAWQDDHLVLLDQRKVAQRCAVHPLRILYKKMFHAIKNMVVRGAPAIGVTAAFGVVLAAQAYRYQESVNKLAASNIEARFTTSYCVRDLQQ